MFKIYTSSEIHSLNRNCEIIVDSEIPYIGGRMQEEPILDLLDLDIKASIETFKIKHAALIEKLIEVLGEDNVEIGFGTFINYSY